MKVAIPLPCGRSVIGESQYGEWTTGDKFSLEEKQFTFIGRDNVGGLHARRIYVDGTAANWVTVFASSVEWKRLT